MLSRVLSGCDLWAHSGCLLIQLLRRAHLRVWLFRRIPMLLILWKTQVGLLWCALTLSRCTVHHSRALTLTLRMLTTRLLTLTEVLLSTSLVTLPISLSSCRSGRGDSSSLTFLLRPKHLRILHRTILHARPKTLHRARRRHLPTHLRMRRHSRMIRRHTHIRMRRSMCRSRHVAKVRDVACRVLYRSLLHLLLLPLSLLQHHRVTNKLSNLIRRRSRVFRSITRLDLRHLRRWSRASCSSSMVLLRIWRRLWIAW